MTPSDHSNMMNRFRFDNQQYQKNLLSHTNGDNFKQSSRSNERGGSIRNVVGKPSIKTLIKVATARDN